MEALPRRRRPQTSTGNLRPHDTIFPATMEVDYVSVYNMIDQ